MHEHSGKLNARVCNRVMQVKRTAVCMLGEAIPCRNKERRLSEIPERILESLLFLPNSGIISPTVPTRATSEHWNEQNSSRQDDRFQLRRRLGCSPLTLPLQPAFAAQHSSVQAPSAFLSISQPSARGVGKTKGEQAEVRLRCRGGLAAASTKRATRSLCRPSPRRGAGENGKKQAETGGSG